MSRLVSRSLNLVLLAVCLPLIIGCNGGGGGGSGSSSIGAARSSQALTGMSTGSTFTLEDVQEFLFLRQIEEDPEIPELNLLEEQTSFTKEQDAVSTPEPVTMVLLGGGLLAMSRRRKVKQ